MVGSPTEVVVVVSSPICRVVVVSSPICVVVVVSSPIVCLHLGSYFGHTAIVHTAVDGDYGSHNDHCAPAHRPGRCRCIVLHVVACLDDTSKP